MGQKCSLYMSLCPNGCGTETADAGVDGTDWCDPCVRTVLTEQRVLDAAPVQHEVFHI